MADLNKSILDTLRKIWERLCTITDLLQNPATTSSTDPEVVCLSNDGGATVVTGWEVFDTATNPPTSTLYIGGVAVTGYSVVPCSSTSKDREILQVCVDGKVWTKVVTFEGDLPITFLWLDDTDAPVAAPDPLLINNANCVSLCAPTVSDAFADDISTLLPATNFIITKPEYCRVLVTTSVGSFTLREKETYYATTDFNCPVTITDVQIVSGSCTLSDIHIISNFKG